MDVTWNCGAQVLTRYDVTPGEKNGPIAEFDFELPASISDLDVRVWVPTGANVRVDTLRIEPLANQQADAGLAVAVG
ncbi:MULTISPECIES: hypothetical protein [Burkholderia]|uniref:Uncharacterized protein n=1 Tax=Burkholderia mayonis TaxID=1385591 RepID=A0A1B4FBL8_9BURK|nr:MULTISPECIES: hypothetical protein [Burkholderia]AOJ01051.1 hypothetical protein WS70_03755 [Burkholderia mayonis]KVE41997.1 hypothetical protein WS69_27590 [Burkholderia sp. BDU5]KVE49903.1 hypothetical protein WS70_19190 [Burkholderia mayonis]